jgi:hypothetical protein
MLLVSLVALGVAAMAKPAWAQPPFQIQPDTHRVRIVNEMGQSIRVKMIGFSHQSRYSIDLRNGSSVTQEFYAGPRILGIYDSRGNLLVATPLDVSRSGSLRLHGIAFAEAAPSSEGAAAPVQRAVGGQFEIEED